MGNRKKHNADNKRKRSNDNTSGDLLKTPRHGGLTPDKQCYQATVSVSDALHNVNTVLFDNPDALDESVFTPCDRSTGVLASGMSASQSVSNQSLRVSAAAEFMSAVSPSVGVMSSPSPSASPSASPAVSSVLIQAHSQTQAPVQTHTPQSQVQSQAQSVLLQEQTSVSVAAMADVVAYLGRIESKLNSVDQKLCTLDKLEQNVNQIEKSMSSLWNFIRDETKKLDAKIIDVSSRVESLEFALAQSQSEITSLRQSENKVKDELLYAQSQSMRSNLVFGNITEETNETHEQTEAIVRRFCIDRLKLAAELVNSLKFERVHRMGQRDRRSTAPRKIVAKFAFFKDRELVRRQRVQLKDTEFFMHEQFPPEIAARRRLLLPKLKAAKKDGKQAWLAYDTLYVDGVPVKDKCPTDLRTNQRE